MRWLLIVLILVSLGCGKMTPKQCQAYATLAEMLALQIAELADPASDEDAKLRKRWADVGKMAVDAGCEHLPPLDEQVAAALDRIRGTESI